MVSVIYRRNETLADYMPGYPPEKTWLETYEQNQPPIDIEQVTYRRGGELVRYEAGPGQGEQLA